MKLLRILGLPIALIYGLIIHLRNCFFDVGLLKSKEFDTPTICVGNLSLGGTGKTPMVEFFISSLQDKNKVAVLSRGYKRKSSGFILANSESTVAQLGDEPFQIHKKFENIVLAVDADRTNGIKQLESIAEPDLIILDDAFQHRKVRPAFSILLTAFSTLYADDYFLPFGTLRDSRNQSKRANVIVVTKCPMNLSEDSRKQIAQKLKPSSDQKILFSYLEYGNLLKGLGSAIPIESLSEKNFTLVTGIADPKPLVEFLRNKGFDFEHFRFKDHHAFTTSEIENLDAKKFIITTEKDFVRLQGKVENMAYIEINHKFIDGGKEELIREIEKVTKLNF